MVRRRARPRTGCGFRRRHAREGRCFFRRLVDLSRRAGARRPCRRVLHGSRSGARRPHAGHRPSCLTRLFLRSPGGRGSKVATSRSSGDDPGATPKTEDHRARAGAAAESRLNGGGRAGACGRRGPGAGKRKRRDGATNRQEPTGRSAAIYFRSPRRQGRQSIQD